MSDKIKALEAGVTVSLRGGGGRVLEKDQEIDADSVVESELNRIKRGDPRLAGSVAFLREGDGAPASTSSGEFDPTDKKVPEVQSYLETATPAERERVVSVEAANKKRKGITEWQPESPGTAAIQPFPEYDALDVDQVLATLKANSNDDEFVAKVKAYEASKEDARQEILDYDPVEASKAEENPGELRTGGAGA